jgi:predicted amidophosphoribosyltransferase
VPERWILDFLKEERLSYHGAELVCEYCGQPVSTGRFCKQCTDNLSQAISTVQTVSPSQNAKKDELDGIAFRRTSKSYGYSK